MSQFICKKGPPRSHDRTRALAGHRRVGARLLPPVQEREARLREVDLQGGELGGRAGEAHGRDLLMLSSHAPCLSTNVHRHIHKRRRCGELWLEMEGKERRRGHGTWLSLELCPPLPDTRLPVPPVSGENTSVIYMCSRCFGFR